MPRRKSSSRGYCSCAGDVVDIDAVGQAGHAVAGAEIDERRAVASVATYSAADFAP